MCKAREAFFCLNLPRLLSLFLPKFQLPQKSALACDFQCYLAVDDLVAKLKCLALTVLRLRSSVPALQNLTVVRHGYRSKV